MELESVEEQHAYGSAAGNSGCSPVCILCAIVAAMRRVARQQAQRKAAAAAAAAAAAGVAPGVLGAAGGVLPAQSGTETSVASSPVEGAPAVSASGVVDPYLASNFPPGAPGSGEHEILYQYCAAILDANPVAAANVAPSPEKSPSSPSAEKEKPEGSKSAGGAKKKRKSSAPSEKAEKKEKAAALSADDEPEPPKRRRTTPARARRRSRKLESEEEREMEDEGQEREEEVDEDGDERMDPPSPIPPPRRSRSGRVIRDRDMNTPLKPAALNTESGLSSLAALASPSPLPGMESFGHAHTPLSAAFPLQSPATLQAPTLHNILPFEGGDPINSPHVGSGGPGSGGRSGVSAQHLTPLQADESGRVGRYVVPTVFQFEDTPAPGREGAEGAGGFTAAASPAIRLSFQDAHTPSPGGAAIVPGSGLKLSARAGGGAIMSTAASDSPSHMASATGGVAGGTKDFREFLDYLQSPARSPRGTKTTPSSATSDHSPPPSTTSQGSRGAGGELGLRRTSPGGAALPLQTPPKSSTTAYGTLLSAGGVSGAGDAMPPVHPGSTPAGGSFTPMAAGGAAMGAGGAYTPMASLAHTLSANMSHRKLTPRLHDEGAAGGTLAGMSPRNAGAFSFSPAVSPRNTLGLGSTLLHSPSVGGGAAVGLGNVNAGNVAAPGSGGGVLAASGTGQRSHPNSRSTSPFRTGAIFSSSAAGVGAAGSSPLPSPQRHVALALHRNFSPPSSPSARSPGNAFQALLGRSSGGGAADATPHPLSQPSTTATAGAGLTPADLGAAKSEELKTAENARGGAAAGETANPSAGAAAANTIPKNPANAPRQRRFDFSQATAANAASSTAAAADAAAGPKSESAAPAMSLPTPTSYFS